MAHPASNRRMMKGSQLEKKKVLEGNRKMIISEMKDAIIRSFLLGLTWFSGKYPSHFVMLNGPVA